MCGIFGYAGFDRDELLLRRMADVLNHRGPDDEGFLLGETVGLGMCRLSIIDVEGGHQPIFNKEKTLAIIFNGEIYNYKDLKKILIDKGYKFSTRSDTETILYLYEEFGPDCVNHLQGMFTFAIYEIPKRKLFLARDRIGEKPLYFWQENGKLVFASEIKSILECKKIPRIPNLSAINSYLSFRYSPGPETMFSGIHKFPAAHWAIWENGILEFKKYWELETYTGSYKSDDYYQDRFAELFEDSVRMRLMSEAPLGAFLSGGVDSTAIVSTMASISDKPVNTFSVGFDWSGDETSFAKETAHKLSCHHHEIICHPEDLGAIPEIIWSLDEPIGDAIIVPMYLLSKFARQHVKVVLTGEGADEVLAGYLFHKALFWANRYDRWTPNLIKKMVEPLVKVSPNWLLNKAFSYPEGLKSRGRLKVLDLIRETRSGTINSQYELLISLFDPRDKQGIYTEKLKPFVENLKGSTSINTNGNYLESILSLQFLHWLPDLMMNKLDKITMASSLEGRVPFLDHKLVEFLFETPLHLKLKGMTDKLILRNHLSKILPGDYSRRLKKPFYMPVSNFLDKKPLKDFVDIAFSEDTVRRRGYFDWEKIRWLRKNIGKDFVYDKQIFSLVSLELWHRIFIDQELGWVDKGLNSNGKSLKNSVEYV
ncbi:MAG: asparagine synthase (glutamine-hydrolyzing) [Nitrospina sp.]|nr:asparagine synthase (glutamine-hydrolyzing) [Nitrospina sp.]